MKFSHFFQNYILNESDDASFIVAKYGKQILEVSATDEPSFTNAHDWRTYLKQKISKTNIEYLTKKYINREFTFKFDTPKMKSLFNTYNLIKKDLNDYDKNLENQPLNELRELISEKEQSSDNVKRKEEQEKLLTKGDAKIIIDSSDLYIVQLFTYEASRTFGKPLIDKVSGEERPMWCTRRKEDGLTHWKNRMPKGEMYMIKIPNANGKWFQFYFSNGSSYKDEFKNSSNLDFDMEELIFKCPKLQEIFKPIAQKFNCKLFDKSAKAIQQEKEDEKTQLFDTIEKLPAYEVSSCYESVTLLMLGVIKNFSTNESYDYGIGVYPRETSQENHRYIYMKKEHKLLILNINAKTFLLFDYKKLLLINKLSDIRLEIANSIKSEQIIEEVKSIEFALLSPNKKDWFKGVADYGVTPEHYNILYNKNGNELIEYNTNSIKPSDTIKWFYDIDAKGDIDYVIKYKGKKYFINYNRINSTYSKVNQIKIFDELSNIITLDILLNYNEINLEYELFEIFMCFGYNLKFHHSVSQNVWYKDIAKIYYQEKSRNINFNDNVTFLSNSHRHKVFYFKDNKITDTFMKKNNQISRDIDSNYFFIANQDDINKIIDYTYFSVTSEKYIPSINNPDFTLSNDELKEFLENFCNDTFLQQKFNFQHSKELTKWISLFDDINYIEHFIKKMYKEEKYHNCYLIDYDRREFRVIEYIIKKFLNSATFTKFVKECDNYKNINSPKYFLFDGNTMYLMLEEVTQVRNQDYIKNTCYCVNTNRKLTELQLTKLLVKLPPL